MDCTILVIQYIGYRTLQINIKSLVFSLKLKLELAVLTRLADFVTRDGSSRSTDSYLRSSTISRNLAGT